MGGRSSRKTRAATSVNEIMSRLGTAVERMENPAVEKIAEDQKSDPFQVLISAMLSAQTKDAVTLEASRRLFHRAATAEAILGLKLREIEQLIYPVSFYRNKARHLKETCRQLLDRCGGRVPVTMAELVSLAGVGRKTANLVLIIAYGSNRNICVDTHVHRIANRLGWVRTRTPEKTEQALYDVVPQQWWPSVNLFLVTWGQNVCRPVYPLCSNCGVRDLCQRVGVTKVGRSSTALGIE